MGKLEALWIKEDLERLPGFCSSFNLSSATGVSIDTRTLKPGDLFVALEGDKTDGHLYVKDAVMKGAAAVVVRHPVEGLPHVCVESPQNFLTEMAKAQRKRSQAKIMAITGSVGKTSTKEALLSLLGGQGITCGSAKSYNNHVGVPLTLARLSSQAQYAILEVGMNHPGEIRPLTEMIYPHVALITRIVPCHLAPFFSLKGIAEEKSEIFSFHTGEGIAIINRDDEFYKLFEKKALSYQFHHIISFGQSRESSIRLVDIEEQALGNKVTIEVEGKTYHYFLSLNGQHWVFNSLAILGGVKALGANFEQALEALSTLQPIEGRGRVQELPHMSIAIIDETYNANPASMLAALRAAGAFKKREKRRLVVVLGEMGELGPQSSRYHAELLNGIEENNVDLVLTCGEEMRHLFKVLPPAIRYYHADNPTDLLPALQEVVQPESIFMFKGSRVMQLDKVLNSFLDLPTLKQGSP